MNNILKSISFSLIILIFTLYFMSCSQEKSGGIALYTLREEMKDNPKETLKEVAKVGYKYIEAAGYEDGKFYGMTPQEFKAFLSEIGLVPLSSHQGSVTFENADQMIADVKEAGFQYFVIPIPPMGNFIFDNETKSMSMKGGVENLSQTLNTIGEKCDKAGLKLLYHNHDFEFKNDPNDTINNTIIIDYLLENTNPKIVNFQLDLFWIIKAGADPIDYFNKYPGRFKIWHVKDMDEQGRFAPVGKGNIDFSKILSNKELSGMEYYFVEQDMTFDNMKPLEAIKISFEGIKKIGFN